MPKNIAIWKCFENNECFECYEPYQKIFLYPPLSFKSHVFKHYVFIITNCCPLVDRNINIRELEYISRDINVFERPVWFDITLTSKKVNLSFNLEKIRFSEGIKGAYIKKFDLKINFLGWKLSRTWMILGCKRRRGLLVEACTANKRHRCRIKGYQHQEVRVFEQARVDTPVIFL